jgi:hypothetical protein
MDDRHPTEQDFCLGAALKRKGDHLLNSDTSRRVVDNRMISFYKSLTPLWITMEEGESG